MAEVLLVMVTCTNRAEAQQIATAIVEGKLAACVSIAGPLLSIFNWEGRTERQSESLLLIKTRSDLFGDLCQRISELHSYEVPEIIGFPVSAGSPAYLKWVAESTGPNTTDE